MANSIRSIATAAGSKVNGIQNIRSTGTFSGNTISNMTSSGGTGTGGNCGMIGESLTGNSNQTLSRKKIFHLSTTANAVAEVIDGRNWRTGKLTSGDMSNGSFEIPVKQLPAGSYVLRISDKNGKHLQITKFTVMK